MRNYTNGRWKVNLDTGQIIAVSEKGDVQIGLLHNADQFYGFADDPDDGVQEFIKQYRANAELIAQAPHLKEEVDLLLKELNERDGAAADALSLLWSHMFDVETYGDWNYPGEAYRHLALKFDEMSQRIEKLEGHYGFLTPESYPTIVCLCGSTRFWKTFQQAGLQETMAGKIVLSIGAASGTDDEHFGNLPPEEYDRIKSELDELHKRKIDLADEVLILNVNGYIGESTRSELNYALELGKPIRYWEEPHS